MANESARDSVNETFENPGEWEWKGIFSPWIAGQWNAVSVTGICGNETLTVTLTLFWEQ